MEGKTSNLCARKNFLLTRDLIELFLNIGEQYHRKFLDSIPQQSGLILFHILNNDKKLIELFILNSHFL